MHRLQRGPAPTCLDNYRHGVQQWCDVSADDRSEIRRELASMQGRLCAYCESDMDVHGEHIEHFRQRSRHPQGTFEWSNLFAACTQRGCCAKHKDECGDYPHADLIKPDEEDPEHFFLFASNGSIAIRTSLLTEEERRRAQETLRVFNLDEQWGRLRKMREIACSGYLQIAKELVEMTDAGFDSVELESYIQQEYEYIHNSPYCTAIKHTLFPF